MPTGPTWFCTRRRSGPIEIDTGHRSPLRDLFSGQRIADGPKSTLRLEQGETRLLIIVID